MSTKLLKRMLRQQSHNHEDGSAAGGAGGSAVGSSSDRTGALLPKEKKRPRKRREVEEDGDNGPADEQDVMDATVSAFLHLDKTMADYGKRRDETAERLNKQIRQARTRRKRSEAFVAGNSRASSSMMRLTPEPTFHKGRHKKEKEQERLVEIARLLQREKNRKKKASTGVASTST